MDTYRYPTEESEANQAHTRHSQQMCLASGFPRQTILPPGKRASHFPASPGNPEADLA